MVFHLTSSEAKHLVWLASLAVEINCRPHNFAALLPTSGRIFFEGIDLTTLKDRELRPIRQRMQMIFQDPYASLNPHMTIRETIGEPLQVFGLAKGKEIDEQVNSLLKTVRLNPNYATRYHMSFQAVSGSALALPAPSPCDRILLSVMSDFCPGCLHPGSNCQPPGGLAGRVQIDLSLHCP